MTKQEGNRLARFIKREAVSAAWFALFVMCIYVLFVCAFERPFLEHLQRKSQSANLTDISESHEVGAEKPSLWTATTLLILLGGLSLGHACELVAIPPLFGMILAGVILRNVPWFPADSELVALAVSAAWSRLLRRLAFVVILLRAGLSLDGAALRTMKGACFRLALMPCTAEAIAVAGAAGLLLGLPLLHGLLLGFILAAVSPAVVVPAMISISTKGYGKGVSTLVMAAASLDDVYAITLFSVLLGIVFSTGDSILWSVLRAPLEVLGGVVVGAAAGALLSLAPSSARLRLLLTAAAAGFLVSVKYGVDSAGALSVLVGSFVAAFGWKKNSSVSSEELGLRILWDRLFQPLLFGLIGFELSLHLVTPLMVLPGIGVLLAGLAVRSVVAFFAVLGSGLSVRERIFVSIAWLPKATVQAALAPAALDLCTSLGSARCSSTDASSALTVFTVAVLAILTTAPAGAAAIRLAAPRLLSPDQERREDEEGDRDHEDHLMLPVTESEKSKTTESENTTG